MAPVESAVSDMSDEPVEAEYEAVAEEPDGPDTPDDDAVPDGAVPDGAVPDSAEAEVAARMSEELEAAEAAAPAPVMPAADFSLPAGTELGFALTHLPVPDTPEASVGEAEADRTDGTDTIEELPATVELGYAFTAVMTARFRPASGSAAGEPETGTEPETGAEPEADAAPAGEAAEAAARDTVPHGEGLDPVALSEAGPETAVTEIVERAVAVAGQDAPPPHPSDTPAQSAGAVGEVEAEKHDTPEPEIQPAEDHLLDGDDPLMTDAGAEDEEEAFSPRDLAADLPPESEKKADVKSDDGSWGYLASLAAGAVVTAFGAVMTWGDWGRMWEARSLTGDAWALIAGVFLMLAAAWSLGSVWLGRLKNNRRNTADAG
jgi:hypothetical protein